MYKYLGLCSLKASLKIPNKTVESSVQNSYSYVTILFVHSKFVYRSAFSHVSLVVI